MFSFWKRLFDVKPPIQSSTTHAGMTLLEESSGAVRRWMERDAIGYEEQLERQRRRSWVRSRLWHNGRHANCCMRCMQAGYVMALLHADRLDLMAEYPELISVYEELVRDGMITGHRTDDFCRAANRTAGRSSAVVPSR